MAVSYCCRDLILCVRGVSMTGIAFIKMATLSEYFKALQSSVTQQGHVFPLYTDDFFPYNTDWLSDSGVRFWSGFYASREVRYSVLDSSWVNSLTVVIWSQNTKFGASRLSAQLRSAEIMQVATLPFTSSANNTGAGAYVSQA